MMKYLPRGPRTTGKPKSIKEDRGLDFRTDRINVQVLYVASIPDIKRFTIAQVSSQSIDGRQIAMSKGSRKDGIVRATRRDTELRYC